MSAHGTAADCISARAANRYLLIVLAVGFLLRLWNIDYQLWRQPDEQNIVDRALLLGHSGLNPRWFAYPSLFLYVLFGAYGLLYIGGRFLGVFASPEQFAAFYFSHPLAFFLIARGLNLACGIASLGITFHIGLIGWGPSVGLVASGILAVSPLFVDASRSAKQDMMMVALLLLGAYGAFRSLDTKGRGWLWSASVAVGLAASTKYTAALGIVWLLAAAWIRQKGRAAIGEGGGAIGLAVLAFVVGTPYAVLDWPTFHSYFTNMTSLMHGVWYGAEDRRGYSYYLLRALPSSLGWPLTLLSLVGCIRWLLQRNPRELLLAGFAVVFYGWMGFARVASDHYVLPILPILALSGADLARELAARVRRDHPRKFPWFVIILTTVCLWLPLVSNLRSALFLPARDTRELAAEWIMNNFTPGTRIISEPYGPRLPVARGRLDEILEEEQQKRPGRGMRLRFERENTRVGEGFWYYEIPLFAHEYLAQPAIEEYNLDKFLVRGYRVVVLSSGAYERYRRFPERYPIQNAFFDRVRRTGELLKVFGPSTTWCCPRTWNERLVEALAQKWGRPGPTLLVYRFPGGS